MSTKTRKARAAYRAARRGLNLDCGHDYECAEYVFAQDRVIRAEKRLPWWKRLDIDLTV
ncbi:hypothetical protein [Micromonospora sp. DT47]|uniref:hypothetical protein n=1 Tax=Micromonospora sp. DT47 TaxID=3393431 RepID=UPI003CEB6BF9